MIPIPSYCLSLYSISEEQDLSNFIRIILLTLWGILQYNPQHCRGLLLPSASRVLLGHFTVKNTCESVVNQNVDLP